MFDTESTLRRRSDGAFCRSHRTFHAVAGRGFAAEPAPADTPAKEAWRPRQPSDHRRSPSPTCGRRFCRGRGTGRAIRFRRGDILGFEALPQRVRPDRLPRLVDPQYSTGRKSTA